MDEIKTFDKTDKGEILRNFLNNTLKEIMSVINAECGSLFLFDSHKDELVLNSFYNSGQLDLAGLRTKIGEGIAGKVVNTKTPILVKDIARDIRFQRNGFNHYKTRSFISIPLFTASGLLGVINLADKSSGDSFSDCDLQFAVVIAKYACLNIDSVQSCLGLKQEKDTLHKQKNLLEKYASVGKLAAGIVHEINNPLDGIIRYTNILLEQIDSNSVAREYLLEVKKGLSRIANITKSLLEFSHQVNSNVSQMKNYADIHGLIDESIDVLNGKFVANITINRKYKDGLPKILDLGLVYVFTNILRNAIDAMPVGGTLDISTDRKDSWVEISFKDSGLGIPADIQGEIFEPFFTTKSIDKGTGLGLAICKEVVNKYLGDINVESAPEKGTTFTILIPIKYLQNA